MNRDKSYGRTRGPTVLPEWAAVGKAVTTRAGNTFTVVMADRDGYLYACQSNHDQLRRFHLSNFQPPVGELKINTNDLTIDQKIAISYCELMDLDPYVYVSYNDGSGHAVARKMQRYLVFAIEAKRQRMWNIALKMHGEP